MRKFKKFTLITFVIIISINLKGASNKSIIKNCKKVIENYIDVYDELTLKNNKNRIYELDEILVEEYKNYSQKKMNIIRKRMDKFDLLVDNFNNSYEYENFEVNKDYILISLRVDKEYKFNNLKESTFERVNYEITLIKNENEEEYLIKEIKSDDIYEIAIRGMNLRQENKDNLDDFIKKEEENIEKEKESLLRSYELETVIHIEENYNLIEDLRNKGLKELNRSKMKNYARKHYDKPSINYYDFTNIGGDCTNFISQIMKSGGAPFDNVGNEKWYYYSSNNRTPSWTSVEFLYNYLMHNKGFGLQAEKSDISKMKIGDIIQIDANFDGIYNHSLVVIENDFEDFKNNLKIEEGINNYNELESLFEAYMLRSPFLLVAARTQNSYNRPLLTYPGEKRFIHLKGFNQ